MVEDEEIVKNSPVRTKIKKIKQYTLTGRE